MTDLSGSGTSLTSSGFALRSTISIGLLPISGLAPREGGQQKRTQRIDVCAVVGLTAELFRRGISVFPSKFIADDRLGPGIGVFCDAKVDNDGLGRVTIAQDDIVGRQITMHDVAPMGCDQTFADTRADNHQIVRRHAAAFQLFVQTRPVNIVHHQIDVTIGHPLIVVIAHDRIVAHVANVFLTRHEHKEIFVCRELGLQGLHSHNAPRNFRARLIDLGRATTPQNGLDAVGVVQKVAGLEDIARARVAHECLTKLESHTSPCSRVHPPTGIIAIS